MGLYFKIRRILRRRLLQSLQPCRQMVPLMSESLDRPLNVLERTNLKLHFLVCTWCSLYLKQITAIRGMVQKRSADAESQDPGLSEDARERLVQSLKDLQ